MTVYIELNYTIVNKVISPGQRFIIVCERRVSGSHLGTSFGVSMCSRDRCIRLEEGRVIELNFIIRRGGIIASYTVATLTFTYVLTSKLLPSTTIVDYCYSRLTGHVLFRLQPGVAPRLINHHN